MSRTMSANQARNRERAYERRRARHDEAVIQAEVRLLSRALSSYGIPRRGSLVRAAHVERWRGGMFDQAPQAAVVAGVIERLRSDPE